MGRGARSSVNEDGLAGHQIAKTINSPSWLIHHSNEGIELPSLDAKLAFTEDHILGALDQGGRREIRDCAPLNSGSFFDHLLLVRCDTKLHARVFPLIQ